VHPSDLNKLAQPQWQIEVLTRSMEADEIDVLTLHNFDLKEMRQNKMFYWVNKISGAGTPELTVSYYTKAGVLKFQITPSSSPYEFPGRFISLQIEETGSATCIYDALIKVL
jgi:hypothetical protein